MKNRFLFFTVFIVVMFVNIFPCFAANKIPATDWMSKLPDDIKITDLNIPGAHDAATVHSSAVWPASEYTLCQAHHIGNTTWTSYKMIGANEKVTDTGLLERGVRYLDIRYGLKKSEFKPGDEDIYDSKRVASDYLKIVHGSGTLGFTCQYQTEDGYTGMGSYETTTNEKLMIWIRDFLDDHPDETVILDIGIDDKDNKTTVSGWIEMFFSNLAAGHDADYPEIYVGKHVPTLGEARGKVVVLSDVDNIDYSVEGKDGDWAFKNKYGIGDEYNKTFDQVITNSSKKYSIYKDNKYKEINSTTKWEWVKNGFRDAAKFSKIEKDMGYDAFMLNYASINNISEVDLTGSPENYAEKINPKIVSYIEEHDSDFLGIVAMDFVDDEDIESEIARVIFETNFNRDFSESNTSTIGSAFGNGSIWIIIIAGVVLIAAIIIAIIYKKKNKQQ